MIVKIKYLLLICCSWSVQVFAQQKAVMILLDGIPTDVIERVYTPHLDEIAQAGGYTHAYVGGDKNTYTETPTVSAPGYMNMITGVWANKHQVRNNSVNNPNYQYWNIFRILETFNPDLETAIFSTWEDNRTKLIGEGKSAAGNIMLDYAFDGFEKDTNRFPHGSDKKYIADIDEIVSKEAARYIGEKGPGLSWVYLEFTDDMGHKFGDSPEMDEAVKQADAQVGRIWEAIQKRQRMGEDWMIVVTTDHGRDSKNGKGHGGQSDRERSTWIITNQADLNGGFHDNPGIVDIMPSLLTHLKLQIPAPVKQEIDGVSFVGPISFNQLTASYTEGELTVSWNPKTNSGLAEIWISDSNTFSDGGIDPFTFLKKVPVQQGSTTINFAPVSDFYKVLVKAPDNWGNVWLER